ncbi:MAG: thioredoxin family protein [Hyphomonadaceae bacterium]
MRPSLISRRRVLAGGAAAWCSAGVAHATAPRDSAESVLAREAAAAAAEDKNLLVVFFASWCVWCRPMDALFDDANTGPIMARHFRILHLRVGERDRTLRAQQLSGVEAAFLRLTRPERDAGLPYLAILGGGDGRTISTTRSLVSGENIGFPSTTADLDWFESMMRQGAPLITPAELAHVRSTCIRLNGRRWR